MNNEQIDALWLEATSGNHGNTTQDFTRWFARAVLDHGVTAPQAAPVATIQGVDEYGPLLGWYKHWAGLPIGTVLYAAPQVADGDYLEGVNIPKLREALTFLGRQNGAGEGEVGADLSSYVNDIVRGVLSCKELLRAAPHAKAADALDAALLDFVNDNRVSLIPEYEGPWTARVYGEEGEHGATGEGKTVREAIESAKVAIASAAGKGE